ncbi:MAG: ThuA domain-containing protein [Isosphaeraceae bacterium]
MIRSCASVVLLTVVPWLAGAPAAAAEPKPVKILLIGKDRDHPPATHEYMNECELLAKCLKQTPGVETTVSNGWPTDANQLEGVSTIVLYTAMGGNILSAPERRAQVEALLRKGVGLAAIHWSTGADDGAPGQFWLDNLGGWFGFSFSKIPVVDSKVRQLNRPHPIFQGWTDFDMHDEYYTHLKFNPKARPLAEATVNGEPHTIAWTYDRPDAQGGRSFGTVCGHFHQCFTIPSFRRMLVNGILWTAHRDVPEAGAPVEAKPEDLVLPPDPRAAKK